MPDRYGGPEKAYQYIYSGTGGFGLIYYWIMDNDAVDTDTLADWIAGFKTPHLEA